jgi:hypothetical protein
MTIIIEHMIKQGKWLPNWMFSKLPEKKKIMSDVEYEVELVAPVPQTAHLAKFALVDHHTKPEGSELPQDSAFDY